MTPFKIKSCNYRRIKLVKQMFVQDAQGSSFVLVKVS